MTVCCASVCADAKTTPSINAAAAVGGPFEAFEQEQRSVPAWYIRASGSTSGIALDGAPPGLPSILP
jgi:hypothetical protein